MERLLKSKRHPKRGEMGSMLSKLRAKPCGMAPGAYSSTLQTVDCQTITDFEGCLPLRPCRPPEVDSCRRGPKLEDKDACHWIG